MTRMTGGQALVQSLKLEGIDTIFGLPGIQMDFAFDALWDERDAIQVLHTRHEQACSYMADGFARTTGKVGTFIVVPGPGLLNASAGLSTAYACSSPVLAVAGQIQSDLIGRGRGVLHEINNQLETISSVCKQVERAMAPEDIPGMVHRAMRALLTGRPRPVEIEVPPDVLERVGDVTLLEPEAFSRAEADPDLLERAAQALGRAERPLIVAGGGVQSSAAWAELRALAEVLEAPVLMSANGRGGLSDRDHRAFSGVAAANALLPQADVVLAVGTRYVLPPRSAAAPDDQTFIQLDIDEEEVGRNRRPDIGIVGDAKRGLGELAARVPRHNRARPSREGELRALQQGIAAEMAQLSPQADYALAIRDVLPDNGVLVSESTQVGYWSQGGGFPVYEPRSFLTSGYQGTLGYGFATALGAQVGNPDRKVVSINGDGGFFYNVQELSTMAKHQIPLVAIVFNDNAFGNVRRIQQVRFNDHTIGSDLLNPDLVKLSELFGVPASRATNPAELRSTLDRALASNAPHLIEVPMPPTLDLPQQFPMEPLPARPTLNL